MTGVVLQIHGRVRGKKNRQRIVSFGKPGAKRLGLVQEKESVEWERNAVLQLKVQWRNRPALTLPCKLQCEVRVEPIQRSDLTNLLSAIGDALEGAGVVKNDRQFRHIDATMVTNRESPGVTMTLTEIAS